MKLTLLLIICLLLSGCWLFPEPIIEPEPIPCAELAKLAVIYDGRYLVQGEVVQIPYNTKVMFAVQGFDISGTLDACLDGGEISWNASCPVVYWGIADGVENSVYVNNAEFQVYNSFVQTCLGWGSEKKVEASEEKEYWKDKYRQRNETEKEFISRLKIVTQVVEPIKK